jgi:TonB family protein
MSARNMLVIALVAASVAGCCIRPAPRETLSLNPWETRPVLAWRVAPVYPADALSQGIEGTVVVHMVVTEAGTVDSPIAVSGPATFFAAARGAASRMQFVPATRNGRPVRIRVAQKIVFRVRSSLSDELVFSWNDVTTKPVVLQQALPEYPMTGRRIHRDEAVYVEIVVGRDGLVDSARATFGPDGLRGRAVRAARQMLLSPGRQDGRPVRVRMLHKVLFRLSDAAEPAVSVDPFMSDRS